MNYFRFSNHHHWFFPFCSALLAKQWTYSTYLAILGVIEFICSYLFISIFRRTSERMVHRVRKAYLRALLRQDVGWYDTVQDKNFVAKLTEQVRPSS